LRNHYEAKARQQEKMVAEMAVQNDDIAEIGGNQAVWIHWRKGIIM